MASGPAPGCPPISGRAGTHLGLRAAGLVVAHTCRTACGWERGRAGAGSGRRIGRDHTNSHKARRGGNRAQSTGAERAGSMYRKERQLSPRAKPTRRPPKLVQGILGGLIAIVGFTTLM